MFSRDISAWYSSSWLPMASELKQVNTYYGARTSFGPSNNSFFVNSSCARLFACYASKKANHGEEHHAGVKGVHAKQRHPAGLDDSI